MKVSIFGGLGNQLFKFFGALNYCQINEIPKLELDVSWFMNFEETEHSSYKRSLELERFPQIKAFPFICRAQSLLFDINRIGLPNSIKRHFCVTEESYSIKKRLTQTWIKGNFEALKYLPPENVIVSILESPEISKQCGEIVNQITRIDFTTPVAVHVRMGDYRLFPNIYTCLDSTYYERAIRELQRRYGRLSIYLFSDDPSSARDMLGHFRDVELVAIDSYGLTTFDEWVLMGNFRAIICANSTFSWWASYLGILRSRTEVAVIPRFFVNGDADEEYSSGFRGRDFLVVDNPQNLAMDIR